MERAVDGAIRLGRAWKALSRERQAAAIAAGVLWLTLFLPWYQASVVSRNPKTRSASPIGESLNGWAAFSGVEALILILSLGTILLLFLRAEGRLSFPTGSDGWVVTVAGALSVFLVILGLFNAPSPASRDQYVLSTGLEWGIFLALLAAIGLTWAGGRMRRSLEEDPILARRQRPMRDPAGAGSPATATPSEPATDAAGNFEPDPEPGAPHGTPKPLPGASGPPKSRARPPVEPMTEANRLGVVEPLTDENRPDGGGSRADESKPGAGKPLTAAAAKRPRPIRAPSPPADPPGQDAAPAPASPPAPAPDPAPAPVPAPRSSWRPGESPAWKDPERRTGWLTAHRQNPAEPETETEAPTRQDSREDQEQLTIPLEPDE